MGWGAMMGRIVQETEQRKDLLRSRRAKLWVRDRLARIFLICLVAAFLSLSPTAYCSEGANPQAGGLSSGDAALSPDKQEAPVLYVVSDIEEYKRQIADKSDMELINLEKAIPGIVLDIRYATKNNFTGEVIYTLPRAYVRKPVANALKEVQKTLASRDLSLKVYDAYRPYAATVKFYEVYPNTDFVADPRYGSRHNRGCAVDVSLVRLSTGEEIAMPSGFDEFSERANPAFMGLSEDVMANRQLLFDVMAQHGFAHFPTEWWHFDFQGWEDYPIMDLSFEKLGE